MTKSAESDKKNPRKYDFKALLEIVERLSAPDGCPWDRAQTHESIRINAIEEAYEAVDAIDRGDRAAMIEELGDMLLQAVFHADIARREGNFDIGDILEALCHKLISRHSHIFGGDKAADAAQSLTLWEQNKEKEKGRSDCALRQKLEDIPREFPALLRAVKVFKKLNNAGQLKCEPQPYTEEELEADLLELTKRAALGGLEPELTLNKALNKIIKNL